MAVTVPVVLAVWAAAVNVTVVVAPDADVGETLPTLEGPTASVVLAGSAVPAVVYFAVSVRLAVLWPSASTVADDGLSVSVIPLVVIVDDVAVRPLYVAVTVAVPSVAEAGAVYVTAIVLAELVGDVGDTEPLPVTPTVAFALLIALPPVV